MVNRTPNIWDEAASRTCWHAAEIGTTSEIDIRALEHVLPCCRVGDTPAPASAAMVAIPSCSLGLQSAQLMLDQGALLRRKIWRRICLLIDRERLPVSSALHVEISQEHAGFQTGAVPSAEGFQQAHRFDTVSAAVISKVRLNTYFLFWGADLTAR